MKLIDMPDRHVKHIRVPRPAGIEAGTVDFTWPVAARHAFKRPALLPPSEWAEKYRINDDSGSRAGPWKNAFATFLCGPMDVFFLPFVREMVIVAPPQTGKTEIMMNQLAAAIDQSPGPALMVYELQDVAKRMCTTRVKNMVELSPRLSRYLTGKADDLANYSIQLKHMRIPFAWATSVSQLSNQPIKYLFLDEVEKYEATNKREAGPVALAKKRTRSFKETSKTVLASSPGVEDGEINLAFQRVQARFEYAVRCPDCFRHHVMVFSSPKEEEKKYGVIWPEEERNPEIIQADNLARYVCPHCGAVWDDYKRDIAVRHGYWRDRETKMELMAYCRRFRPRSVGFQYSALISSLVSLSETAGKFLLAQQELKFGRVDPYKDWLNGYMAEIWKEDFSPRKEASILVLRDDREPGLVPDGSKVAALLASVDTQDDGFYYEVRAWGYGLEMESWQVRAGYLEAPEGYISRLDDILWIPYIDVYGNRHFVQLVGIDLQGHRASEVYEWCIANRGRAVPIKGEPIMKDQYSLNKVEVWPGTTKKMEGGVQRLHVNTKYYKDTLHRKLNIAPTDPGAYHMNAACSEAWAKMLCVEYPDEKGMWVCPKGVPNHAFDVSVYGLCVADLVGTRYMQPPEPEEYVPEAEEAQSRPRHRPW